MRARLGTQEIKEYNILRFMSEKFGVKPHELEKYDPEWVERMLAIAYGENIGNSNKSQDRPPAGRPGTITSKITTSYGGNQK